MKKIIKVILIGFGILISFITIVIIVNKPDYTKKEQISQESNSKENQKLERCDNFLKEYVAELNPTKNPENYENIIYEAEKCVSYHQKYGHLYSNLKEWRRSAKKYAENREYKEGFESKGGVERMLDRTEVLTEFDPKLASYYKSFLISTGRDSCVYKKVISSHFLLKGNSKFYRGWEKYYRETCG